MNQASPHRPKFLGYPVAGISGGEKVNDFTDLDTQVSLYPFEEQFDLPALVIQVGDQRGLELQLTQALRTAIRPTDTLVLVTHKGEMLELVDRLIVIANHQVMLDGPKAQVLQKLQAPPPQHPPGAHLQRVAT